jgi:dipeptidyl aminopeptidase/acylaminoacyl peptidase
MLLTALRPRDPRYVSPALEGFDAELSFAVACWPIADPLARYQMARHRKNERLVSAHEAFFGTEEIMAEANPQLILERGEQRSLPPLLVLQGTKDDNVTPDMAERFVASYRAAGGNAILETFENQPHTFVTRDPTTASSLKAIDSIRAFVLSRGHAE